MCASVRACSRVMYRAVGIPVNVLSVTIEFYALDLVYRHPSYNSKPHLTIRSPKAYMYHVCGHVAASDQLGQCSHVHF